MAAYIDRIKQIAPELNPRHVLAWMRSNVGGPLDHLSPDDFDSHARYASVCAAAAPVMSARLAEVMGI